MACRSASVTRSRGAECIVDRQLGEAGCEHELEVHIGVGKRAALVAEYDVHISGTEQIIELLVRPCDDAERDLGVESGEFGDGMVQRKTAVAAQIAYAQPFIFCGDAARPAHEHIRRGEHVFAVGVEVFAGHREREAPVSALKQLYAQLVFQGANLL